MGALDAAPLPLRPVDEPRLEGAAAVVVAEYFRDGGGDVFDGEIELKMTNLLSFKGLRILILLCLAFQVFGCKNQEVQGIEIGDTLLVHQNLKENKEMVKAISQVMKGDEKGISSLANFDCGGSAGCYDLGFIMSQIVQKVGETEFVKMTNQIEKDKLKSLSDLVSAGLEYGDSDKDGKPDGKKLEETFPQLAKLIDEQLSKF